MLKDRALKFFLFLILSIPFFARAAQGDIIINEVAWMGTSVSTANEWMELYDETQSDINISGWKLETQDGKLKIILSGIIPAKGFFLLERTDDKSVPEIKADQIYSGALSNGGEVLMLKDPSGQEVFHLDAAKGWPAGDAKTKDTMQWIDGAWASAKPTPKSQNISSSGVMPIKAEEVKTSSSQEKIDVQEPQATSSSQVFSVNPEPVKTILPNYSRDIIVNEFLPNPKGSDENAEWIELYNQGQTDQNISGFYLDDKAGGSPPYKIPQGTIIKGNDFLVFKRSDTNIALNNQDDAVRLLSPAGYELSSIAYKEAKEDEASAYDANKKEFFWTRTPTPGKENIISLAEHIVAQKGQTQNGEAVSEVKSFEDAPTPSPEKFSAQTAALKTDSQPSNTTFWISLFGLVALLGAGTYQFFFKKSLD